MCVCRGSVVVGTLHLLLGKRKFKSYEDTQAMPARPSAKGVLQAKFWELKKIRHDKRSVLSMQHRKEAVTVLWPTCQGRTLSQRIPTVSETPFFAILNQSLLMMHMGYSISTKLNHNYIITTFLITFHHVRRMGK